MTHDGASGPDTPFLGATFDGVRGHIPDSGNSVDEVIDPFDGIAGKSGFDDRLLLDTGQHLLYELCAAQNSLIRRPSFTSTSDPIAYLPAGTTAP